MNAALYMRSAINDMDSIKEQLKSLEQYCDRAQHTVVGLYIDNGISGNSSIEDRPAIIKLLKEYKSKSIDAICVIRIDRISRNFNDCLIFQKRAKENDFQIIDISKESELE
jgi:DNA invertase Pin-like site-specific DNA recombinase